MRILIVEDDKIISKNSRFYFEKNNIITDCVYDLKTAEESVYSKSYDVILLDRRLPDGDGLELIKRCKSTLENTPIIVLSAKTELSDKLDAFDNGVMDYVTKPFALPEVLARINTLLKRNAKVKEFVLGKLSIDLNSFSVKYGQKKLIISGKTLLVLQYLMENHDKVISREDISDKVLNVETNSSNLVDVHISMIRKELNKCKAGKIIKTIKGRGYMICSN